MDAVIGPVVTRNGGYAFDLWTGYQRRRAAAGADVGRRGVLSRRRLGKLSGKPRSGPMPSNEKPIVPDLSQTIREAYHRAIAETRTPREAFDLAVSLAEEERPQPLRSARRAVARMLAYEPYLLVRAPHALPPLGGAYVIDAERRQPMR
jgi:hypothetical protein